MYVSSHISTFPKVPFGKMGTGTSVAFFENMNKVFIVSQMQNSMVYFGKGFTISEAMKNCERFRKSKMYALHTFENPSVELKFEDVGIDALNTFYPQGTKVTGETINK
jgi:hypothetical protein